MPSSRRAWVKVPPAASLTPWASPGQQPGEAGGARPRAEGPHPGVGRRPEVAGEQGRLAGEALAEDEAGAQLEHGLLPAPAQPQPRLLRREYLALGRLPPGDSRAGSAGGAP